MEFVARQSNEPSVKRHRKRGQLETDQINLSFTVPTGKNNRAGRGQLFLRRPARRVCSLIFTEVGAATTGTKFNVETSGVGAFGGDDVL
jgi:hypothetical protein